MSDDPWISSHLELRGEDGEILSGYGWIFPLGTGEVNLGVGTLATAKRPADVAIKPLMSFYADERREEFELGDELRMPTSALLPMGGAVSNVAGPNWALIGDAAACVNPLNGEGIDYGLETGRLVAELMAEHERPRRRLAGAAARALRRVVLDRPPAGRAGDRARGCCRRSGPVGMRSDWLMTLALRWMGNLVTDEDRDRAARVWRWAGRRSLARDHRPPFSLMGRRRMSGLPKRQRVAAYAVILRDERILLSRLSPSGHPEELWTLPGGGLDHGEDPRDAVVREVHEETGLDAVVGETARVYSAHLPGRVARRSPGRRARAADRVRRLGAARRARSPASSRSTGRPSRRPGSRSPTCSTAPCRWRRWCSRRSPTTGRSAHQRLGAYALVRRGDAVLLTRISARGFHTGSWTLPGGGVDHGEPPRDRAAARAARGVRRRRHGRRAGRRARRPLQRYGAVGALRGLPRRRAWSSRRPCPTTPSRGLVEVDGTTDAVAWVPVADIESGALPVLDVVRRRSAGRACAAFGEPGECLGQRLAQLLDRPAGQPLPQGGGQDRQRLRVLDETALELAASEHRAVGGDQGVAAQAAPGAGVRIRAAEVASAGRARSRGRAPGAVRRPRPSGSGPRSCPGTPTRSRATRTSSARPGAGSAALHRTRSTWRTRSRRITPSPRATSSSLGATSASLTTWATTTWSA